MSDEKTASPPLRVGDVTIGVLLLLIFIAAFVLAQEWPFRARFFPQLLSGFGVLLGVLKLVGFFVQWRRSRRPAPVAVKEPVREEPTVGDTTLVSEEEEEDHSLEYVFATAGKVAWSRSLGWIFGFFFLLWLTGVFIAVPVFAFLYLAFEGRHGWLGPLIYAAVAGGILYVAFGRLLAVPMPQGVLF